MSRAIAERSIHSGSSSIGSAATELWRLSATELAHLIRARKVSAREAAEAALQRLDAVNPKINAIVEHRPELVRAQADRIDGMLARGEDPGPLAGVPVTVKINTDQAGFATTNGTRLQTDLVAQANSPAVDNLVKAGAVLLGRSNAPAFALRWFTSNLISGSTRNPRDPSRTPGGSTGGGAISRSARISAVRFAIRPMHAGFTGCARRSGAFRPSTPPRRNAPSVFNSCQLPAPSPARSRIFASRWPRCRPPIHAIRGGCRRH
jgi:Amidase